MYTSRNPILFSPYSELKWSSSHTQVPTFWYFGHRIYYFIFFTFPSILNLSEIFILAVFLPFFLSIKLSPLVFFLTYPTSHLSMHFSFLSSLFPVSSHISYHLYFFLPFLSWLPLSSYHSSFIISFFSIVYHGMRGITKFAFLCKLS